MNIFLVIPQEVYVGSIEAKINEYFNDHYITLPGRNTKIWLVVADKHKTSYDISVLLNIDPKSSSNVRNGGIVFDVGSYYGCDYTEVWQKLETWRLL